MNATIYISSGAFRSRDLDVILDICENEGFNFLELSSGLAWGPNLVAKLRKKNDCISYLIHNYFPPPEKSFVINLASSDQEQLRLSRDHCLKALDLTYEFGGLFYSVHSGFAYSLKPKILGDASAQSLLGSYDYEKAYDIFLQSLHLLCKRAGELGLQLLIENNVVAPIIKCNPSYPPLLMARAEEIERLFKDIKHPALKLLLDVGHAKVSSNALCFEPLNFIERVSPYVAAIHLSDNDGMRDSNEMFEVDSWFANSLYLFDSCPMIIEVYNLSPVEIRNQIAILKSILKKMN